MASDSADYLTKLWMCPSTDLMIAMNSKRPTILQRVVDAQSSANLLLQLEARRAQRYGESENSTTDGSCSTFECESDAIPLAEDSFSIKSQEDSFETDDTCDNDMLDLLKRKLKTAYKEKMKAGAELIVDWSLAILENNIYEMVKSIRQREKDLIDQQLQPLIQFINQYIEEVNAENGYKLTKKYDEKRLEKIVVVIDNAEESFKLATEQAEKHIKESFQFKYMETKVYLHNEYRNRTRDNTERIKKRFQLEKNSLISDYNERMLAIWTKYENMNNDLNQLEETKIMEEVKRFERARCQAQQQERRNKIEAMEEACCEEAGWLYVLDKLIKDIKKYTNNFATQQSMMMLRKRLTLDKKMSLPVSRETDIILHSKQSSAVPTSAETEFQKKQLMKRCNIIEMPTKQESTSTLSVSCASHADDEASCC